MTTEYDDIVRVTITRESAAVQREGFGVPCFVSPHTATANRVDVYAGSSALADMLTDGFLTSDPAYLQAARALAQFPRVPTIKIGRIDAGDANLTASLTAIEAADPAWYGFTLASRVEAQINLAAAWVETRSKIFFAQSADAGILTYSAGNVLEDLEALNYRRTALFYHNPTAEDYLDAGAMARFLVADLDARKGAVDLAHKTIAGVAPDVLSAAQRANVHGPEGNRRGNTYETRNRKQRILWGDMVGGMAIDETMAIDWLEARIGEDVDTFLSGNPGRVDFSQDSIDGVENALRARLRIAENNGVIQPEAQRRSNGAPGWWITMPTFVQTQASDREAHLLRNVEFDALVVVGLRRVQIQGRVTV